MEWMGESANELRSGTDRENVRQVEWASGSSGCCWVEWVMWRGEEIARAGRGRCRYSRSGSYSTGGIRVGQCFFHSPTLLQIKRYMATADNPDEVGSGLTLSSMVKEIQGLKDKFKREDSDSRASRGATKPSKQVLAASPFADLEKATVLQECRVFSDSKIVTESPRKCSQLITKLLHIVTQGDTMSSSEVTDVFFGVTKLFQSSDASLRRMVYFFIKEVAHLTASPNSDLEGRLPRPVIQTTSL